MTKFDKFKEFLLNIIYPKHITCVFCDEELDSNSNNDTCVQCLSELPFLTTNTCERCGGIVSENNENICLNCKANNFEFDLARSVFNYEDKIVSAIHKYKYSSHRYLLEPFGNYLSKYLASWNIHPDYITSVPLHPNREKARGYNQAKCMAELVSKNFGIPYVDICEKTVDNKNQARLDFKERRKNVKDVYKLVPDIRKKVSGSTILLIDDVYTTGSTCSEVAKIIKSAGVSKVYVLTLAHAQCNLEV